MKKLVLSLFALGALSLTSVCSYAFTPVSHEVVIKLDEDEKAKKTEIKMTDVPKAVKDAWAKSDYSKEKVEKIFKVSKTEGLEGDCIEFLVNSSNGKVAVRYNLEGKLLSETAVS